MSTEEPGPTPGDDRPILDDDAVYRRLSDSSPAMLYVDPITGGRRPTTAVFHVKPDEDGVSVYRERVLHGHGLTAADVVKAPQNLVASLGVGDVRSAVPLDVRDDPWPEDIPDHLHPRNAAHALIVGWAGLTKSQRKEHQVALVNAPSLHFVYP